MVKFLNEVKLPKGSQNVTFHDKMSPGLTLVEGLAGEYGLTVYTNAALTDAVVQGNYVIKAKDNADGCTVEVSFNQDYLDWQESDITLYIVYYATVNENAVVGSEGNPNESHLSYGEEGKTTTVPSKTTTYTWEIDVYKYTVVKATAEGEKDTEKALEGAVFTLSKSADGTDPIALVKVEDNVYRVAKEGESNTVTEITTDATGRFTIKGLDSDTYYLTEKTAPAGYNTLKEPVEVVIGDDGEVTYNKTSTGEVKVLNQTGAELPSTGGMGTTVFYVLGSALVLGAAVLLITRRRMRR